MWNKHYQELETGLNEQYDLYKQGKLDGAEFSRQINALEYANEGAESRFAGYVQTMPNSSWSHLLHGLYLVKQAEDARGSRSSAETSEASFDKMRELAEQAKALLETAHQHQASFSLYAGGMIRVNRMLGTREENKRIVNEAMARDRDIWRAANAYFLTLDPQWGGSEAAMAEFITEVAPKNPELAQELQADSYWRRGRHYQVRDQIDAAISQYELAIQTYPHELAFKDLGEIYLQTGNCEQAVDVLERNLEENDEWDLWTLEALAQSHECAGNSWRAKRVNSKRSELFARYSRGE